jgi:hypothetical protein
MTITPMALRPHDITKITLGRGIAHQGACYHGVALDGRAAGQSVPLGLLDGANDVSDLDHAPDIGIAAFSTPHKRPLPPARAGAGASRAAARRVAKPSRDTAGSVAIGVFPAPSAGPRDLRAQYEARRRAPFATTHGGDVLQRPQVQEGALARPGDAAWRDCSKQRGGEANTPARAACR